MHQIIKLCDAITATVETRATGFIRLSLDHPVIDLQRADMTASQALALSRALLLAHDIKMGTECGAFTSNAGEGAQGGHPQRLTAEQANAYAAKYNAKSTQAGRINWLAVAALACLVGFWTACGMAIKTAIEAGAVVL